MQRIPIQAPDDHLEVPSTTGRHRKVHGFPASRLTEVDAGQKQPILDHPPSHGLASPKALKRATSRTLRRVVISTFPPRRDGIARYAEQLSKSLNRTGPVMRIGLPGSLAHHVIRVRGGLRPLRILSLTRRSDEILLMWHPEFYVSGPLVSRMAAYVALGLVFRRRTVMVYVHELPAPARGRYAWGFLIAPIEQALQRWCWSSRAQLCFHSRVERDEFARRVFGGPRHAERGIIVDHRAHFRPYADVDQARARQLLGLTATQDDFVFLCIGFLGHHKGFDRAIQAFGRLPAGSARLYVVGSALYELPEVVEHVQDLRTLAATVPSVILVERFVNDAEFDHWIRAANAVLLPYRSAASSSVLARAILLGTAVIASTAGALPEQIGQNGTVVRSDEELADAMRSLVTKTASDVRHRAALVRPTTTGGGKHDEFR